MKNVKIKPTKAWTWFIPDEERSGLCYFAFPTKQQLIYDGKPTENAKPQCVMLVPYGQYWKKLSKKKINKNTK